VRFIFADGSRFVFPTHGNFTIAMASVFRSLGLTFADVGFVKFNLSFPVLAGFAHYSIVYWVSAPMSTKALAMLPVPVDKAPFFVVAVLPLIAIMCAITVIMAISAMAKNGYESQRGRQQKEPGALAKAGLPAWLDRVQSAQYNTFEACICMICSFYVATGLGLDKVLFAKLASYFLVCRLMYPFMYGFDIDLLRTVFWFCGLYALIMTSFAALFPDTVLPMLGVALGGKK